MSVAIAQLEGDAGFKKNLKLVDRSIEKLRTQIGDTDILVFSEGFLTGYYVEDTASAAVSLETVLSELSERAISSGFAIISGYLEKFQDSVYNSAVAIDQSGSLLCNYRKFCLYGDWEKISFRSGNAQPVFHLNEWCIGLSICYDIEFPEIARNLAVKGAQVIITPTALMQPFGESVFTLVSARAIENRIYVIYANRIGQEHDLTYVGGSRIIAPDGRKLAEATSSENTIIHAQLDVFDGNGNWNYLQDFQQYFDDASL